MPLDTFDLIHWEMPGSLAEQLKYKYHVLLPNELAGVAELYLHELELRLIENTVEGDQITSL